MGNKGNNRHIKRLAAPRYLHIGKKVKPYVVKPNSGRHTLRASISIATVLVDKLGIAGNAKEAKRAIKSGNVEVNGRVIKDERYPLGFADIIHLKPSKESYRIGIGIRGTVSVDKEEGKHEEQVFKVIGKFIAKGNKEKIRLHNGNILPSIKDVKVNDSVKLKDGKVSAVLKMQKGARCVILNGIHASESGVISDIKQGTALRAATVEIEGDGVKTETLLDNVIVVGVK